MKIKGEMGTLAFSGWLVTAIAFDIVGILVPFIGIIFVLIGRISFWISGYKFKNADFLTGGSAVAEMLPIVPGCIAFVTFSFINNRATIKAEKLKQPKIKTPAQIQKEKRTARLASQEEGQREATMIQARYMMNTGRVAEGRSLAEQARNTPAQRQATPSFRPPMPAEEGYSEYVNRIAREEEQARREKKKAEEAEKEKERMKRLQQGLKEKGAFKQRMDESFRRRDEQFKTTPQKNEITPGLAAYYGGKKEEVIGTGQDETVRTDASNYTKWRV